MPHDIASFPPRQDRRKERTRAALIAAAQQLIRDNNDLHASIQAITDLAGVGFGSFYNHFSTKEELFEAAISAGVDDYVSWLDEQLSNHADPTTRLFESVRRTGCLAIEQPQLATLLGRRLLVFRSESHSLGQRVRSDVVAAMSDSPVTADGLEFEILMTAALGAIQAVLRRALTLTPEETVKAADVLAHAVLRILVLEAQN